MFVIAEATFSDAFVQYSTVEFCANKPSQDTGRLACAWRECERTLSSVKKGTKSSREAIPALLTFLRNAQDVLSGTASNYDLLKMYIGIGVATLALAFAAASSATEIISVGFGGIVMSSIILSYAILIFASSYVEEEQQFWYWALGGWLIVLNCKE